jgi:hypothetical protein
VLVVFMMMILTITTTSFFPLSELFDRECARAVISICVCRDRGLNEERRGGAKKSTETLNKTCFFRPAAKERKTTE